MVITGVLFSCGDTKGEGDGKKGKAMGLPSD